MSAIDSYLDHNAAHAEGPSGPKLPVPPSRRIAVVTCMDARIDPAAALGVRAGEAHVIRNAGALATDDVIRSLLLSQRLLGTREIMLIQHTECGLHGLDDEELARTVEAETGERPGFEIGAFEDLEENVRAQLARLETCSLLPHTDAVRGFVYDVDSGRLREVR